jgi:uncharacterized protein (TIGR02284 family)
MRQARLRLLFAALDGAAVRWVRALICFHGLLAASRVPRTGMRNARMADSKDDGMKRKDIVKSLNDLIGMCRNGEKGFEACARHARAPELNSVFSTCAAACARAAEELETQVRALGGTPEHGGKAVAALHRGWLALRSLTGFDDHALLRECGRGEDAALRHYRQALEKDLPSDIRSLVVRQAEGTRRNHDQVRALRDRYPSAA